MNHNVYFGVELIGVSGLSQYPVAILKFLFIKWLQYLTVQTMNALPITVKSQSVVSRGSYQGFQFHVYAASLGASPIHLPFQSSKLICSTAMTVKQFMIEG